MCVCKREMELDLSVEQSLVKTKKKKEEQVFLLFYFILQLWSFIGLDFTNENGCPIFFFF